MNYQVGGYMAGGSRRRYEPPATWREQPFGAVLAASSRAHLDVGQLELLGSTLYLAGDEGLLSKRCVAVIGARKASPMGRQRARQFARQLVERGIVVVSGLADGIDTEALTAAIEAGGRVIAVIGTPLDGAYPAKNKELQETIYRDHLLISQFPAGSRVFPSHFPARNRTMAALSDASVVIEASDTSGTLHQAVECQRLGRWLGITKSVVADTSLSWPAKFLDYPKTAILETTDQFIGQVYGGVSC